MDEHNSYMTAQTIQQVAHVIQDVLCAPSLVHKAKLTQEDGQWVAFLDVEEGFSVEGKGDTPAAAMLAFDTAWNKQAPEPKAPKEDHQPSALTLLVDMAAKVGETVEQTAAATIARAQALAPFRCYSDRDAELFFGSVLLQVKSEVMPGQDRGYWSSVLLADLFDVRLVGAHGYAIAQAINSLGKRDLIRVEPEHNDRILVNVRFRASV